MAKLAKPSDKAESVKKVSNLTKTDNNEGKKKPLQFIVSENFHKEFKLYATDQGMKMNELFDAMYKLYRENN
ncbi:MAG: chromosome segregation and condensation protein ScpB [Oleiphilaceae bacterium]|jgi:chromosome segregation and condensation protein ScpB